MKENNEEQQPKSAMDNSIELINKVCEDNNINQETLIRHMLRAGLGNNNQRRQMSNMIEEEYTYMQKVVKRNQVFLDFMETNIKVDVVNRKGFPTSITEIEDLMKKNVKLEKEYIDRINKMAEELKLEKEKVSFLLSRNEELIKSEKTLMKSLSETEEAFSIAAKNLDNLRSKWWIKLFS